MKNLNFTLFLFCFLSFTNAFGQIYDPCEHLPDTIPSVELVPKEVTVTVQDMYSEITMRPAQYKVVYEKILIKNSYHGYRFPVYIEAITSFLAKEASSYIEVIPAVLEKQLVKIETSPAYTALVKDNQSIGGNRFVQSHHSLCAWNKIKIPSKTISYEQENLITPATIKEYPVPAEYETIFIKAIAGEIGPVLDEPITIEAEYIYYPRKVLYAPARTEEIEVPAITKTITIYEAQSLPSLPSLYGNGANGGG